MADETQIVLFKIDLDITESNKNAKDMDTTMMTLSKSLEENTKAVSANSQESKRMTEASRATKTAIAAEAGSIDDLRNKNKELTKARNATSDSTEAGRKKIMELNTQLDANNAKIKSNVDNYTKQKMGIGDYTSGIIGAIPGLKGMTGGVQGLNVAFKANPIGLVITLLLALKEIFMGNAAIADKFSFIMGGLNKGFQFIIDTIKKTVTSLDNLTNALAHPIDFIMEFVGGLKDAAVEGYNAAEAMDQFVITQAKMNQAIQLTDKAIENQEKLLKDKTKSEQERIEIANKIADMEIQNAKRREDLVKQELANEQLRLKGKELSSEEEAKLIELNTKVLIESENARVVEAQRTTRINILLAKEEARETKEAKADERATDKAEREKEAAEKKALKEKENKEEKERLERAAKDKFDAEQGLLMLKADVNARDAERISIKNEEDLAKYQELIDQQYASLVEAEEAKTKFLLENDQLTAEQRELIKAQSVAREQAIDTLYSEQKLKGKQELENNMTQVEKVAQETRRNIAQFTHLFTSGLFKKNTIAYKAAKVVETTIATYESATAAYASASKIPYVGWILGPIAAGLAIASGLKSLSVINSTSPKGFAGGGYVRNRTAALSGIKIKSGMGLPITRSNGDDMLATVKTGEVILNERHQAALGGSATFKRIGVPGFASSGATGIVQAAAERSKAENEQEELLIAMREQKVVLPIQDFEAEQAKRNSVETKATVLS